MGNRKYSEVFPQREWWLRNRYIWPDCTLFTSIRIPHNTAQIDFMMLPLSKYILLTFQKNPHIKLFHQLSVYQQDISIVLECYSYYIQNSNNKYFNSVS